MYENSASWTYCQEITSNPQSFHLVVSKRSFRFHLKNGRFLNFILITAFHEYCKSPILMAGELIITNLIKKTGFKGGNSFWVSLVQKSVTKLTFLCQIPGKQCRCTLNFYSQLTTTNPAASSGTEPYTFRHHPFFGKIS